MTCTVCGFRIFWVGWQKLYRNNDVSGNLMLVKACIHLVGGLLWCWERLALRPLGSSTGDRMYLALERIQERQERLYPLDFSMCNICMRLIGCVAQPPAHRMNPWSA